MSFPELLEVNPGFHLECLVKIAAEIIGGNLIQEVGQGIRRTLPAHLVVT
jgi:hypothetical protein